MSGYLITPDKRKWLKYEATKLWRVRHDDEFSSKTLRLDVGGKKVKFTRPAPRENLPQVYSLEPTHRVYMDKAIQFLCYDLFRAGAPSMTATRAQKMWRQLYDYRRAFTNKTGFENPNDPRVDYVHGLDYTCIVDGKEVKCEEPALDKGPRVCGGASIKGVVSGDVLLVETIDSNNVPSLEYVLARPWLYFHATTFRINGKVGRFPQGDGEPVFVPLISDHKKGAVAYPLAWLEPLPAGVVADPYWQP